MNKIFLFSAFLVISGCDSYKSNAKEKIENEAKEKFVVESVKVDLYEYMDSREFSDSSMPPWNGKAKIYYEKDGKEICKDIVASYTGKFSASETAIEKYDDCKE